MLHKNSFVSVVKPHSGRPALNALELQVFCYILSLLKAAGYGGELSIDLDGCAKEVKLADEGSRDGVIAALFRLSEEVMEEEGPYTAYPIFERLTIRGGEAVVKINEAVLPILKQLDSKQLQSAANCTTAYSRRLYEFLVSEMHGKRTEQDIEIPLDMLRELFEADSPSYVHFGVFRERVLDPSVGNIRDYTDMHITYKYQYSGRRIVGVVFTVSRKGKTVTSKKKPVAATSHVANLLEKPSSRKTAKVVAQLTTGRRSAPGFLDIGDDDVSLF